MDAKAYIALVCGAVLGLQTVTATAKPSCNTHDEVAAVQLRQLQIQMMVSVYRCDSSTYDFPSHYSSFVQKINPLMTDNVKHLKGLLARTHLGNFDHYLTDMSNDAQNLSQTDPNYCGRAVGILDQVAAVPTLSEVPTLAAQSIPAAYGMSPCPDKQPEASPKKKSRHKPTNTAAN